MQEMQLTLTAVEARILGALIEKESTTPEYYPPSLNALTNACNQKSNRDPAMQLEESEIRGALNHLEGQSLVRPIAESRATKYEHRLQDAFNFYRPEMAIICELLLRGPQTPGELRTRASRIHAFEDLEKNVREQVMRVKTHPWIPKHIPVRGFVYDVKTGALKEVEQR